MDGRDGRYGSDGSDGRDGSALLLFGILKVHIKKRGLINFGGSARSLNL